MRRLVAIGLFLSAISPAYATLGILSNADRQEYNTVASTHTWAAVPSAHYRFFIDIYDTAAYYDSEPNGDPRFSDITALTDTIRPVVTALWERWRLQAGAIAQRTFGDNPDFSSIDPWIQMLWHPTDHLYTVMGDLDIPHDFLPAIYYAPRYFDLENNDTEKGVQLLNRSPNWDDDLYFNYRQFETANRQEKFDLGYVHHNKWEVVDKTFVGISYQAHYIHTGGDNFPHPIQTISDVAQTAGVGIKRQFGDRWIWGVNWWYLHSHHRQDSSTPSLDTESNGNGRYLQAYFRYSRFKMLGGLWRGYNYFHETGDQYFETGVMRLAVAHWDLLISPDFNLFGEVTGYFIGNNTQGYSRYVKSTFMLQASWHFAIPSKGWTPSGDDDVVPTRWDTGL